MRRAWLCDDPSLGCFCAAADHLVSYAAGEHFSQRGMSIIRGVPTSLPRNPCSAHSGQSPSSCESRHRCCWHAHGVMVLGRQVSTLHPPFFCIFCGWKSVQTPDVHLLCHVSNRAFGQLHKMLVFLGHSDRLWRAVKEPFGRFTVLALGYGTIV